MRGKINKNIKRVIAGILCFGLLLGNDATVEYADAFLLMENKVVAFAKQLATTANNQPKSEESVESVSDTEAMQTEAAVEDINQMIEEESFVSEDDEANTQESEQADAESQEKDLQVSAFAANTSSGVQLTEAGEELQTGVSYLIKSYDDWTKLQTLSQTSSLEGMTFVVYKRESKYDDWTLPNNYKIGNETYPFAGTLYSYYSTTIIYANTVIFDYLSSKARIGIKDKSGVKTFILSYSSNVAAGLANYLVFDSAGGTLNLGGTIDSNYYVKIDKATISSSSEVTGGLFAHVYVQNNAVSPEDKEDSIYQIVIGGTGVDLSGVTNKTVTGTTAGGLIGEIHGDIAVTIEKLPQLMTSVISNGTTLVINSQVVYSAAGGFIGYAGSGVVITLANPDKLELTTNVASSNTSNTGYCAGGLIGFMDGASLMMSKASDDEGATESAGINRTGNTSATRYVGGLIGYAVNASIRVFDYTQYINTYIYQSSTSGISATNEYAAGGVIGKYQNTKENGTDFLDLSYIKTSNKISGVSSQIRITAVDSVNAKMGGLVGSVDGGKAEISFHDINTDTNQTSTTEAGGENCFYVSMTCINNSTTGNSYSVVGGLVGNIAGEDINIANIYFNYVYNGENSGKDSNTIGGGWVGDIAGRVGNINNVNKNTRMVVQNIWVVNSYIRRADSYHGGLFGYVSNSVIALQGTIDLQKVPYVTIANSNVYSGSDAGNGVKEVLLASFRKRGFVAGYAERSLIYEDTGCKMTRPITYQDDGSIIYQVDGKEYSSDTIYSTSDTANTNATHMYCIDDIGNAGSVFKNVDQILDITKDYSQVVTGSVTKDADGNYVIDSLSDALRLAIAGNTVGTDGNSVFGANCFANEDGTLPSVSVLFSKNFKITTDLNLADAGIHGFIDNSNVKYAFTGQWEGVKKEDGTYPTITLEFISKQKYGGLFPNATNATFKNFNIGGRLNYLGAVDYSTLSNYEIRGAAGSIAAYARGQIYVENVRVDTTIKQSLNYYTSWDNGNVFAYGGLFGYYISGGSNITFTAKDCMLDADFSVIRSNSFAGGMIGWAYANASNPADFQMSGCTISTDMTTNATFSNKDVASRHLRSGGLIAMISADFVNTNPLHLDNNKPGTTYDVTYAKVDLTDMKVFQSHLDYSISGVSPMRCSGGFLGYAWLNTEVTIHGSEDGTKKGITISDSTINSRGVIGGLLSYLAGKADLSDIEVNSLTMTDCDNSGTHATYCGLLIGNGQEAYVVLDAQSYRVASDGSVVISDYNGFDEIVGLNVRVMNNDNNEYMFSPNQNVSTRYSNSGIVNIVTSSFMNFASPSYCSYLNQATDMNNKYTRYYYNLFSGDAENWNISITSNTASVLNEKQWMTFSVASYANTNIQRYMRPYLNGGTASIGSITQVQVEKDLDFTGYSLYPTPLSTGKTIDFGNHSVTLYGEKVSTLETDLKTNNRNLIDRNNELSSTQHYLMHASLFNDMSGSTVKNLTLKGSAANIGTESGALVIFGMTGSNTISGITMDNLTISHYSDTRCGLLIGSIGIAPQRKNTDAAASITISGVKTTGYSGLQPVAASLIGYVGSKDATDIRILLSDMQLEDEKNGQMGKVFKYASYIYSYRFTENFAENRCYVSYTFTKDENDQGTVTYGDEIKAGIEYLDQDKPTDSQGNVLETDLLYQAIQNANNSQYIPYVYTERNIYVNPRNGNLTEGCGTYEDPYIIRNAKQLLTLYLYLADKTAYEAMFNGTGEENSTAGKWQVVPVGGDADSTTKDHCCNNDTGDTGHQAAIYGSSAFPTREDLRTAYYKLADDIDLSAGEDLNDAYIASEYCGLGSPAYPFSGVIIGTKSSSECYTITLPEQGEKINSSSGASEQLQQTTFGLIQYMNGAVVKDVVIRAKNYDQRAYYNVTSCGGGVAAKIVGGDNIIDNVKVSVNFNTENSGFNTNDGTGGIEGIGGLVGVIEDGSLILRNIQNNQVAENCSFENYSDKEWVTSTQEAYDGNYDGYVGILVGVVKDGYVLYEGYQTDETTQPQILERANFAASTKYMSVYPLMNRFHMINANVFDSAIATERITFAKSDANHYLSTIHNAAQLEMLALALNSDAFSVYYCKNNDHDTGYNYQSRCRKANYSNVGALNAKDSADRKLAVTYDDNKIAENAGYLYPYICYRYMDYTALADSGKTVQSADTFTANNYAGYRTTLSLAENEKENEIVPIVSNVNKMVPSVANYTTTYQLAKGKNDTVQLYDLSGYDISFRGFGAIYTNTYSDFRANFDGQGNQLTYYVTREFDKYNIKYSGLFNELTYNQKTIAINTSDTALEIKNFTVVNSVVYNPNYFWILHNKSWYAYYNGLYTPASGMIVGQLQGVWNIENIQVQRNTAITKKDINGKLLSYDVSGYKNVGGLIGRINNTDYNSSWYVTDTGWLNTHMALSNQIMIENCDITGTSNSPYQVCELGTASALSPNDGYHVSYAGGLVGGIATDHYKNNTYAACRIFGYVNFKNCDIDSVTVTLLDKGDLGGIAGGIGIRYHSYTTYDAGSGALGYITVDGSKDTSNDGSSTSTIQNLKLISKNTDTTDNNSYSAGGCFGRVELTLDIVGGQLDIRNYLLKNIEVDAAAPTTSYGARVTMSGDGGVIGYSRTYLLNLEHITIEADANKYNSIGHASSNKDSGGLVGTLKGLGPSSNTNYYQNRCNTTINITDCKVSGTHILSKYGSAGGFLGREGINTVNIGSNTGSNTVTDCLIQGNSGNSCAGGVIGSIYNDGSNYLTTADNSGSTVTIKNITVKDTTILDGPKGAGGLIGWTESCSYKSYINISGAYVYSTDGQSMLISNTYYAGGLIGFYTDSSWQLTLSGKIGIGDSIDQKTGNWAGTASGANISAQNSGGLIGRASGVKYSESYSADIRVAGNRIYAYVNNDNTNSDTYSGGLYGYLVKIQDTTLTFQTVTVENNVILNGANNGTRNKNAVALGSGGLFGYICTNSNSIVYMPYVTLKNNSIGLYTGSDKAEGWKKVTTESKEVKLLEASQQNTTMSPVSWKEISDLSDSTIGRYSEGFGQFIGWHQTADESGQIYILSPTVVRSKELGSIPVIDVGTNTYSAVTGQSGNVYQEGYPYTYRKYCHIVYKDDMEDTLYTDISASDTLRKPVIDEELLIDGEKEYMFGTFAAQIAAYRGRNSNVTATEDKNYNYICSKRLDAYMPYNDDQNQYSICTGDYNYYDITYDVEDENGNTGVNILNGVPVLVLDGLDPQSVGDYAAFVLTNGGGVVSSSVINALNGTNNAKVNTSAMNRFWTVTCENAYIDTDGTIRPITSDDTRFSGHTSTSIQVSNYNRLKLATSLYDEFIPVDEDHNIYTITLLCYTYTCPAAEGEKKETFYIPVYVKEKVSVDSFVRILSNEEYSLTEAQKNGYKDVVAISHDSTYTIYAEFVYDGIRWKDSFINDCVNKTLVYDAKVDVITVGTTYTLVDCQTGVSYYYIADGTENNQIPFTAFCDKDGNAFVQRNISDGIASDLTFNTYRSIGYKDGTQSYTGSVTYTDEENKKGIGVERYLIVVEPPEEENNSVFSLRVDMAAVDINGKAVDEFFNKNSQSDIYVDSESGKSGINVTYIPGPTVEFGGVDESSQGTEGVTFIKGKISSEDTVEIDANVEVVLKDELSPYWDEKNAGNTIDSANTDKYLEIAISLLDENNELVAWPTGTNISVNGGPMQLLTSNLVIYTYKDQNQQFEMNSVDQNIEGNCYYYNILERDDAQDMRWVHEDGEGGYYYYSGLDPVSGKWSTTSLDVEELSEEYIELSNQLHLSLDFSVADIDDYNGKNYTVMMKLYRSDSPDYPNEGNSKASSDSKRQYSDIITGESIKELAGAIEADNLMDLGINLYQSTQEEYEIAFTSKLDFSDLIKKSRESSDISELAEQNYMVVYRLYKKVSKESTELEEQTLLGYNEQIGSSLRAAGDYEYQLMDWDNDIFTLCDTEGNALEPVDITVNDSESQNVIILNKTFSKDEIKNGTRGTEYVTDWKLILKAKRGKIQNEDLTNYMIRVTYLPYSKDAAQPDSDQEENICDYFIFTVTNLKTDM